MLKMVMIWMEEILKLTIPVVPHKVAKTVMVLVAKEVAKKVVNQPLFLLVTLDSKLHK